MRKLYYYLLPLYLIGFVIIAVLKFIIPATPMGLFIKTYFLLNFVIMAIYLLFGGKFKFFSETLLFYLFSIIPLAYGIHEYGFKSETLSHIFAVILPILGIPFGYFLGENYKKDKSEYIFKKIMKISFFSNAIIVILFQLSVTIGLSRYPAVAPTGLILSTIYYLSNKEWKYFLGGIVLVALSGKRASLVMVLFALLIFIYDLYRNKTKDRKFFKKTKRIIGASMVLVSAIIGYLWNYTRYLNRFKLVLKFDFSDPYAMYIATGGRSEEIFRVLEYLNEKPLRYIIGSGFGAKVEVADNFYRHYSHFSPLAYVLIFGLLFSILIYLLFFNKLLSKVNINHPLYFSKLFFAGLFASSFLGAVVLNDVNFWIFYGMTIFLIHDQNKNGQIRSEIF